MGMHYSTAELTKRIEDFVIEKLAQKYKESKGLAGFYVFDLYTEATQQPYGQQITTGFFNKIVADMRTTGLLKMQTEPGGKKSIFLSDDMAKRLNVYFDIDKAVEAYMRGPAATPETGRRQ